MQASEQAVQTARNTASEHMSRTFGSMAQCVLMGALSTVARICIDDAVEAPVGRS